MQDELSYLTGRKEIALTIVSDGTPDGTEIIDLATGKMLFRVSEIKLHMKGGEPCGVMEITIRKPQIRLKGLFTIENPIEEDNLPESVPQSTPEPA